jgi:hypothetical protein
MNADAYFCRLFSLRRVEMQIQFAPDDLPRCETKFFAGVRLALEGLWILARHASVW